MNGEPWESKAPEITSLVCAAALTVIGIADFAAGHIAVGTLTICMAGLNVLLWRYRSWCRMLVTHDPSHLRIIAGRSFAGCPCPTCCRTRGNR